MSDVLDACWSLLSDQYGVSELTELVVAVLVNVATVVAAVSVANVCSYWLLFERYK